MADIMILNKRIRQLRLSNNLTAKEFGEIFDISSSSVSLYESGKRTPSIELITRIAKFFNVSTDYLLGISSIPNPPTSYHINTNIDIAKIFENLNSLLDIDEKLVFKSHPFDDELKNLLRNSLTTLIDTYTFIISNRHIS